MSDQNKPTIVTTAKDLLELKLICGMLEENGIPSFYNFAGGTIAKIMKYQASFTGQLMNEFMQNVDIHIYVPGSAYEKAKELVEVYFSSDEFVFCEDSDFGEVCDEYEEFYIKRKWRKINIFICFILAAFGLLLLAILINNS